MNDKNVNLPHKKDVMTDYRIKDLAFDLVKIIVEDIFKYIGVIDIRKLQFGLSPERDFHSAVYFRKHLFDVKFSAKDLREAHEEGVDKFEKFIKDEVMKIAKENKIPLLFKE